MKIRFAILMPLMVAAVMLTVAGGSAAMAQDVKPNILVVWGDDIGQFGKNRLGDRDEHLPTMHGFDEFFGNPYDLNAEEKPENKDYPPRQKAASLSLQQVMKTLSEGAGSH